MSAAPAALAVLAGSTVLQPAVPAPIVAVIAPVECSVPFAAAIHTDVAARTELSRVMAALDPVQHTVVRLVYVEEMSVAATSQHLGVDQSVVLAALSSAFAIIARGVLGGDGCTVSRFPATPRHTGAR